MTSNTVHIKNELSMDPVLACCLCLASESDVKLSFINLSDFYNFFKPCGIGSHIPGVTHYNYTCQFCRRRATQSLRFLRTVHSAERLYSHFLKNELTITDELLHLMRHNHVESPVNLSECMIVNLKETNCQSSCDTEKGRFTEIRAEPIRIDSQSKIRNINFLEVKIVPTVKEENADNHDELAENVPLSNDAKESVSCTDKVSIGGISSDEDYDDRSNNDSSNAEPSSSAAPDPKSWLPAEVEPFCLTREEVLADLEARRQSRRYLEKRFKCHKCAISFHEQHCLDTHNESHSEDVSDLVCDICTRRFLSVASLQSHESRHRNRWRCLRCGAVLTYKDQVFVHIAACSSSDPVQCRHCGKMFKSKVNLNKHIGKIHMDKRTYVCDICGKTFNKKQTIIYHMRVHTKEKPYACAICGKKSSTSGLHFRHMELHKQKDSNDPNLYCVECDKYFKNKHNLNYHYTTTLKHNTRDNFKHTCAECGERFALPVMLRQHRQRVHVGAPAHPCRLCDKAYYRASSLALHHRSKHEQQRRPRPREKVCAVCGKAFTSGTVLRNHARTHTLERPFQCLVCSATFGFSASLYTHTRLKHKTTPDELRRSIAQGKQPDRP